MADRPHLVVVAKGGPGWLGGRQYSINLLRALLAAKAGGDDYDVSVLVREQDELAHYEPLRPHLRECADYHTRLAPSTVANRLRWFIKRRLLGWTNPRFEEPLAAMGASFAFPFASARIPSCEWLSDFQFRHYPDRMSAEEIAERTREFSNAVRDAPGIVLSSHDAQRDCHDMFPQSVGRTAVLQFRVFADPSWLEVDPVSIRSKYHLPERFALISNWLLPTKNHELVLEALAKTPPADRAGMHIVCTGDIHDPRNPGFYNRFLSKIHTLGVAANVSVLGVIPKSDQIQLLRLSVGYLQPSLFEGWNTGVEEARLFGKRILVSDIPIHREQDLPSAVYFHPTNADDLAAKLPGFFDFDPLLDRAAREAAAFAEYNKLQVAFGRRFLEIAEGRRDAAA